MYTVVETKEYIDWFNRQNFKEQAQIQARRIKWQILILTY